MGTFSQGRPTFAVLGKTGLLTLARNRLLDLLRRIGLLRARGNSTQTSLIMADMEEVGVLSRTLVQVSMGAARKAGEQRKQIHAMVKIEERIRASARLSLENSQAAARMTESLAGNIDVGTKTIETANRNMSEMVETVAAGTAMMEKFVASIGEVNRIVGQITGIARQTNLLALNAAVEASHAGAEGDGFSVIAQEVRLLADRASQATAEIIATIGEMAATASVAGDAMQAGRVAAEKSIGQTVQVQESLQTMRDGVLNLLDLSKKVADASEQQLAAGAEVTVTVESVSEMVAGSTSDADSAAEMSIKMVASAQRIHAHLEGWSENEASGRNMGRRATDIVLQQVEEQKAGVLAALSTLRAECAQHGPGIVHGTMHVHGDVLPGLYFGGQPSTEGTAWVDGLHERTGCGATIFVLADSCFVRVVTNIKLANGERATGTKLNPVGLAVAALKRGMSHFGAVYVIGNPFVAAYEPVFSQQGKVIGALYVGRPLAWDPGGPAEPN